MSVNLTNIKKTIKQLTEEIKNLETQVSILLIEKQFSCPFCGENFLDENSPIDFKYAFKNHLEICPKSPLHILLNSIEESYNAFGRKDIHDYTLSVYHKNFEETK